MQKVLTNSNVRCRCLLSAVLFTALSGHLAGCGSSDNAVVNDSGNASAGLPSDPVAAIEELGGKCVKDGHGDVCHVTFAVSVDAHRCGS